MRMFRNDVTDFESCGFTKNTKIKIFCEQKKNNFYQ